ncbi:MAG: serpin family protein [Acidimicrobiales bacterium]
MSPTSEPAERAYTPTAGEELLVRTKRRSLAIRRHRKLGAGVCSLGVLALVLGLVLVPGGSAAPQQSNNKPGKIFISDRIGSAYEIGANEPPPSAAPRAVVEAVENAEVGFSLELLNKLAASSDTNGSSNELVSPSSLATALAMLELGAAGSTEQGIASALRSAGLSAREQAEGWYSLAALLAGETSTSSENLKRVPELDVANSLWVQQNFAVLPSFVRALESDFQTGVWQVNFQTDLKAAVAAINQWTSEHTKGLIKQLFSPGGLTPTTVLVLADAVFFHADWSVRFEGATTNQPFYLATGASESVPFLSSEPLDSSAALTVPVSRTGNYVAVELPYAGKKLSALVVMPKGSSLPQFVASLSAGSLGRIVASLSPDRVAFSMPTFTLRSDNQLSQTLSSMGMSQAFETGADFSRINATVPLAVDSVEQHAYLQVTPKGTTAAAATGIGIISTATPFPPPPIVIDHPFLFLLRDNRTGAVLFESMVENPAS